MVRKYEPLYQVIGRHAVVKVIIAVFSLDWINLVRDEIAWTRLICFSVKGQRTELRSVYLVVALSNVKVKRTERLTPIAMYEQEKLKAVALGVIIADKKQYPVYSGYSRPSTRE